MLQHCLEDNVKYILGLLNPWLMDMLPVETIEVTGSLTLFPGKTKTECQNNFENNICGSVHHAFVVK